MSNLQTDRELLQKRVLHEWRAMGRMSGVSVFPLATPDNPTAVMFEIIGYPELSQEQYDQWKKDRTPCYCCTIGVDLREMDTVTSEEKMADLIRIRWMNAMIAMWDCVHREKTGTNVATAAKDEREQIPELKGIDPAVWKTEPGKVAGKKTEGSGI